MGDNALMKTFIVMLALPTLILAASANRDLAWVDEQIDAIIPKRVGLNAHETAILENPFRGMFAQEKKETIEDSDVKVAVEEVDERKPLRLQAIFNRKKAMIDGKWYRTDDKIYGYSIKNIENTSVLLRSKKDELRLYIASKKSNIKIQTK